LVGLRVARYDEPVGSFVTCAVAHSFTTSNDGSFVDEVSLPAAGLSAVMIGDDY